MNSLFNLISRFIPVPILNIPSNRSDRSSSSRSSFRVSFWGVSRNSPRGSVSSIHSSNSPRSSPRSSPFSSHRSSPHSSAYDSPHDNESAWMSTYYNQDSTSNSNLMLHVGTELDQFEENLYSGYHPVNEGDVPAMDSPLRGRRITLVAPEPEPEDKGLVDKHFARLLEIHLSQRKNGIVCLSDGRSVSCDLKDSLFRIPNHIIIEIFSYLTIKENAHLANTSKKVYELLGSDFIWREYHKQLFRNPTTGVLAAETIPLHGFRDACKERYHCPMVGDRIQIFWKGQFILAQQGPYVGKAWWFADVTEVKEPSIDATTGLPTGTHHIRYEGWQNTWDEWVDRSRIRWFRGVDVVLPPQPLPSPPAPADAITAYQQAVSAAIKKAKRIKQGDAVELQICGRQCTAWLECTIADVIDPGVVLDTNGIEDQIEEVVDRPRYLISDAIRGQQLLVERDRLRLI